MVKIVSSKYLFESDRSPLKVSNEKLARKVWYLVKSHKKTTLRQYKNADTKKPSQITWFSSHIFSHSKKSPQMSNARQFRPKFSLFSSFSHFHFFVHHTLTRWEYHYSVEREKTNILEWGMIFLMNFEILFSRYLLKQIELKKIT